ncbi:bacillithiol biosynthesis cysteine-adding enzyme BshC [Pontibacter sp. 172403-2]|uniref:bacillithiol biosynthesis cysteine-adding enzyme BshC n=1 Tax=Pontibacter rufus TaxID=2791028 RepID=UPI0018AF7B23|nr:bacillithiol biosynthesis cysteine-adding enzyme BshC [Pontibacter sp. 172403-2]MBF9252890.1 bacillithiol biosynthesis cysteine-adding enzyme BshC [Pontibacter sp. 172403-2]
MEVSTMKVTKMDYAATGAFSQTIHDYLSRSKELQPFYNHFPDLEAFEAQLKEKSFSQEQRRTLHQALQQQYASVVEVNPKVQQNIDLLLQPNTYTVTTGHQLNIFTGPLYFVYKIITAINTCKQLQEKYPDYNFVPVYWMATEDHDFAEINHFSLFGKTYTWETAQTGAVGRFTTADMAQLLEELPEAYPIFEEAYRNSKNLADATRTITHALFGDYGLVSIDGDDAELKKALTPVVEKELTEQLSNRLVEEASAELEQLGYKPQVYSREINLFYLKDGLRERIVQEDGKYKILNTDISFSRAEILQEAKEHPERFSPNVILRPLYEELVLPNLAYIGGGAEVAYWFQLKKLFAACNVAFPVLMLRNSGLYISRSNAGRMHKLGLQPEDLFKDYQELKKQLSGQLHEEEISLDTQQQAVAAAFEEVKSLAESIDPTLVKAVAAEEQKAHNALQLLEKKISKARDNKHEQTFKQLENLKEKLFPGGGLQERYDNLLSYKTNNPDFIPALAEAFDPFDLKFTILEEA